MKLLFQRPRPSVPWAIPPLDYSFPSGHTMNSVAFYGAIAIIVWSVRGRRAGSVVLVAAAVLSLFVGISRIYLGYHYFTDVLGGILAGTSWLLIVLAAFRSRPLERYWFGSPAWPPTARPPTARPPTPQPPTTRPPTVQPPGATP
jgi:membrane-associated phospholipid phosphatase